MHCVWVSDIRVRHSSDEEPETSITRGQLQPQYENRARTGGKRECHHSYRRMFRMIPSGVAVMHLSVCVRWHQEFSNMFPVQLTKRSKWV